MSTPGRAPSDAIAAVTVGVRSLDQALRLWCGDFTLEPVARRRGPDPELCRLFGLDGDGVLDQALVSTPDRDRGRLHLVEFREPLPPVRLGAAPVDRGPKNLDLLCSELPGRYEALRARGHVFRSHWIEYEIDDHRAREVQMPAHDEVNVVLAELVGSTEDLGPGGFAGVTSFVSVVADPDAEERFYREVLGLELRLKQVLRGVDIERMVGLAPGVALDVRVLGAPHRLGRVELVHYQGAAGADLYPRARPPATGILHATFLVTSLGQLRARASALSLSITEHGSVRTLVGEGPTLSLLTPAGLRVFALESHGASSS